MLKVFALSPLFALIPILSGCGGLTRGTDVDAAASAVAEQPAPDASPDYPPHLVAQHPAVGSQALAAFARANRAIEGGDQTAAQSELRALVVAHPDLSGPPLNLALIYQRQGDAGRAEQFFLHALSVNPANLAAYNQFAIFLREQGRFRQAEETYQQALAQWDAHADTHRNLGVLYDLYLGDRNRALQHFNRYQELTGAGDVQVAGWIADLERQLMILAQGRQGQ